MVMHGGGFSIMQPKRPISGRCSGVVGGTWTPGSMAVADAAPAPLCPEIDSATGFRHLLRPPGPDERCRLFIDPQQTGDSSEVRRTLSRLVKRMRTGFWPEGPARDNPAIPSGYTYLLQFMSHDLVQSSLAVSTDPRLGAVCDNLRHSQLRLATLYGGGPIVTPAIFAIDDPKLQTRARFRLGPMQSTGAAPAALRDIPRVAGALASGGAVRGLSEPLIADPRNDDHALVSQLTVLFELVHNALVDLLPASGDGFPEADALHRFLCAREACTQIYHNIIRHDVLPRLLQPKVHARYAAGTEAFLDQQGGGMPLEFSHAAFRIGHAMVRDNYVINTRAPAGETLDDLLERTSSRAPGLMPLNASWIVQWSKFFDLDSRPNLSQRIGPQFSGGLTSEALFPHVDETQELGLPYRDLVSGAAVALWSVAGLMEEIRQRAPGLVDAAPLADAAARAQAITSWLSQPGAGGGLTPGQIDALASDPPLAFFVLFEAATEADGTRLGTLGSIIVAEVMFQALGPDDGQALPARLEEASTRYFGSNLLAAVPDIRDMSGLITFAAQSTGLNHAVPEFL